ncbi:MAG: nodulation S family protein [Planctomycetes bacterium]|nr:nodulation S family protein [Planctomycetota bacterium]
MDRQAIDRKAANFFDELWRKPDAWEFETSDYEQRRFARLAEFLAGRRFGRVLEIGCGAGAFTRRLAAVSESVVALDVSEEAIARAASQRNGLEHVVFRRANVMGLDVCAEGPWDLVVLAETIYYLGWLYPFFDVAWLAGQLHESTAFGGRLLLANTQAVCEDLLILPWLIRTYRDLFVNVGFTIEAEEIYRDAKNDFPLEILSTLFQKT